MKFHNYSSPPEKVKTRSGTAAEQSQQQKSVPQNQKQLQQQQQASSLKKKISPQQLLQLQRQSSQQAEPLAKRIKIEPIPGAVTEEEVLPQQEEEEEDEERELDTSATESETEMDQTADEDMETTTTTTHTQRLDASALKARGGPGTILLAAAAAAEEDDSMSRKKVKRKLANSVSTSSSSNNTNNNTSTKAKLQMVHEFPTLFLGLRRNRIFLVNSLAQSFELNQRDIILTLRKIKLNEHNARLASVFGLTDSEVEVLFRTSVPKIADCLRNFIVWPDDITMKLNVPINLRQHFNKIHLILNYLVVKVRQNAVKHLSQAQIDSSYCELDQCHKLKYLVASTLDGCVCFVSRGFGIQTDDEAVLAQSGFLTKFKTNTNLIAGKNFHNFEDRLTNGNDHDHENNNGGGGGGGTGDDSDLERTLTTSNEDDNFEEIVSEKISKSRTFKLKHYIESVLESFQGHLILSPGACVDGKTLELLDDVVVIVGALINLQKQEVD